MKKSLINKLGAGIILASLALGSCSVQKYSPNKNLLNESETQSLTKRIVQETEKLNGLEKNYKNILKSKDCSVLYSEEFKNLENAYSSQKVNVEKYEELLDIADDVPKKYVLEDGEILKVKREETLATDSMGEGLVKVNNKLYVLAKANDYVLLIDLWKNDKPNLIKKSDGSYDVEVEKDSSKTIYTWNKDGTSTAKICDK